MIDISALDEHGLEDILSEPTDATRDIVAGLSGDIVVWYWGAQARLIAFAEPTQMLNL